jgi:hypothetical protein
MGASICGVRGVIAWSCVCVCVCARRCVCVCVCVGVQTALLRSGDIFDERMASRHGSLRTTLRRN